MSPMTLLRRGNLEGFHDLRAVGTSVSSGRLDEAYTAYRLKRQTPLCFRGFLVRASRTHLVRPRALGLPITGFFPPTPSHGEKCKKKTATVSRATVIGECNASEAEISENGGATPLVDVGDIRFARSLFLITCRQTFLRGLFLITNFFVCEAPSDARPSAVADVANA
ncbi:hypothetical protein EVAR_70751_1 [Eumeta japonica]|uniref:Uncharacterized protein n=1 Tax=Eumeta variegata TaxID=151549 RepID=A0A4C2A8G7_EUMVA|nr:hypothetical protein EVAR_70751_1 [Eumeta japonica]